MRQFALAIVAFAAVLTITPSALADSFGYTFSGSNLGSSLSFDPGYAGFSTVAVGYGLGRNAFNAGWAAGSYSTPPNGAFFFDNLLYPGASGNGVQDRGAALVDISGNDLVLLSANSDRNVSSDARLYYADKGGYHISNETPKGMIDRAVETTALAVTPEPGSLFLLGTGLLGMALVLFWRGAKRPTDSSRS